MNAPLPSRLGRGLAAVMKDPVHGSEPLPPEGGLFRRFLGGFRHH